MKFIPELEKFLREKRVLSKFKRNATTFKRGGWVPKTEGYQRSITGSFSWCKTPEGQKFWSNLSNEFHRKGRVKVTTANRIMTDKLERFLVKKGVLHKFRLNMTPKENGESNGSHEKYPSSNGFSFFWANTPEGHSFWENLYDEFTYFKG